MVTSDRQRRLGESRMAGAPLDRSRERTRRPVPARSRAAARASAQQVQHDHLRGVGGGGFPGLRTKLDEWARRWRRQPFQQRDCFEQARHRAVAPLGLQSEGRSPVGGPSAALRDRRPERVASKLFEAVAVVGATWTLACRSMPSRWAWRVSVAVTQGVPRTRPICSTRAPAHLANLVDTRCAAHGAGGVGRGGFGPNALAVSGCGRFVRDISRWRASSLRPCSV